MDYALLSSWGNDLTKCTELRIPAGTLLFTGIAGEQIIKNNDRMERDRNGQMVGRV